MLQPVVVVEEDLSVSHFSAPVERCRPAVQGYGDSADLQLATSH
jgi:hypothetical protein